MSRFSLQKCPKCGRLSERAWITCARCGGLMVRGLADPVAPAAAPSPAAAGEQAQDAAEIPRSLGVHSQK
jgi:hypothetical protein